MVHSSTHRFDTIAWKAMSAVKREPKMASPASIDIPKIGSVLAVEVEQALPDLLMVSLKAAGKVFRGILLDSSSGACPLGVPDPANLGSRLKKEFDVPVCDTAVIPQYDEPGTGDTATKTEVSALSFRQSYFQNMPLPPARPLLFGKKDKTPEIKPKTIGHSRSRPFRLRPRQLLCTKCKSACSAPKAKTAQSSRPDRNGLKKRKADSTNDVVVRKKTKAETKNITNGRTSNMQVVRKKAKPVSRTLTNGGSHLTKPNSGATTSHTVCTPAKSENKNPKKTSPAIKISYATPGKKQRLIVRIPPRTNAFKQSTDPPSLVTKEKKRVLSVPLSPLTAIGRHNIESLKRPIVNGLTTNPLQTRHDKIRIVKTKGTYSIPADNLPVRTYNPLPGTPTKLINGNGKLSASVTVKPIPLVNGCTSINLNQKKERFLSLKVLPRYDNSDAASDCSSHTSRSSGRGGRKKKNGSINNNNSECEFDSDASGPKAEPEVPKPTVHKKNVTKSILPGGRRVCVGDIIWGKITGFPWWPGRIVQIIVTRNPEGTIKSQEAQITWFASRSISYMPLEKLPPFLADFKKHYDKKRKGVYKEAISQATKAAEALSSEVRELHTMFETPINHS